MHNAHLNPVVTISTSKYDAPISCSINRSSHWSQKIDSPMEHHLFAYWVTAHTKSGMSISQSNPS